MKNDIAELKIDSKTFGLQYNFNDIVEAEAVVECNLLSALINLGGGLTCAQLRGLLYAMIVPCIGFPKTRAEQVEFCGRLIRIDTINDIVFAIGEASAMAVSEEYAGEYKAGVKSAQTVAAPAAVEEEVPVSV